MERKRSFNLSKVKERKREMIRKGKRVNGKLKDKENYFGWFEENEKKIGPENVKGKRK